MRKFLLLTISILTMLTACSKYNDPFGNEEEKEEPIIDEPQVAERTVLIYVAAENNLDVYLDFDLEEMKAGSSELGKGQNLVIYVNRADTSSTPYMARVYRGNLVDKEVMPEAIAADPTVLSLVLSKTRESYPAKSYGLVLWGHCTGWVISNNDYNSGTKSYGGSTGDNTNFYSGKYWMDFPDMADVISEAMEGDKLKFIFGDCCNFVSIEAAYELRNVTEYVIGSPAEIPDRGAPYHICVPDFFLADDGFYRQLIDHYYNYWLDVYAKEEKAYIYYNLEPGDLAGFSVPLSAIKTSELDDLATATSSLLATISDKVHYGSLGLDTLMYYAYMSFCRYAYDMNLVFKRNAASQDFMVWKSFYDKAVPYTVHSAEWLSDSRILRRDMPDFVDIPSADCGSVGMFFPNSIYDDTGLNWNKAIRKYQWNNVIHWEQYGW